MHIKPNTKDERGADQAQLDHPSSPLSPPQVTKLDARSSRHEPPMSVIVVKETNGSPWSSTNDADMQQRSWAFSPPSAVMAVNKEESESSLQKARSASDYSNSSAAAPSPFSSFKLKPRRPVPVMGGSSMPGRGVVSTRGRKRPAQSISIPAVSVSSAESPLRPPRATSSGRYKDCDASTKDGSVGPRSTLGVKDAPRSPNADEVDCLKMNALSLQSPVTRTTADSKDSPSYDESNRPRTSSFTMYGFSPAGSVGRGGGTSVSGSSSSLIASRTPSSSTRSSPKHVPLTVLSQGQAWSSPSKNSLVRPPRHDGGSSLLFSLDQNDDDDIGYDDGYDVYSPRKSSTRSSGDSSISTSSQEGERKPPSYASPSLRPTYAPSLKPSLFSSPSRTPGTTSSPRTPLPKIMLTPRTPQSVGSRRKAGLPMFPSPSDDDIDMSSTSRAVDSSIDDAVDDLLHGVPGKSEQWQLNSTTGYLQPETRKNSGMRANYFDSSNSLAFSVDDSKGDTKQGTDRRSAESAHHEEHHAKSTLPKTWLLPPPADGVAQSAPKQRETYAMRSPDDRFSQPRSHSLLSPQSLLTPSSHEDVLRAMMQADARAKAADTDTGSLSDSNDDDEFVLTCPMPDKSSSEGLEGNRRTKLRRCESYEPPTAVSSDHQHRGSMTSLTSALASANSLLGMGLCLEESQSTPRATTPFSSLSLKSKGNGSSGALSRRDSDEACAPSMGLRCRKSEQSFGSLGLCLDGSSSFPEDQGRDLVTPPITTHMSLVPPPLNSRQQHHELKDTTPGRDDTAKESPIDSDKHFVVATMAM